MNEVLSLALIFVLGTAIVLDLRWRRIPNWLTGPAILAGFGLHTAMNQWTGLIFSLEGAAVGLGLFLMIYVEGWMGAGDVKLYAAVGSFLGPVQTLSAVIIVALAGGLLALVVLGASLGWRTMGVQCWNCVRTMVLTGAVQPVVPERIAAPKVPYAVAIGLGTIWSYWWSPI